MRRNIRTRIFFAIFITVSIIYAIATSLIILDARKMFLKKLKQNTENTMQNLANYYNSIFGIDVEVLRSVKNTLMALPQYNYSSFVRTQNTIIKSVMSETPQFLSMGVSWEISAIDPYYSKDYGRYRYLFYRSQGKLIEKDDTLNVNDPGVGSLYYMYKISKKEGVTDIYYDSYTGRQEDRMLMSSIVIPFVRNDKFLGLIAVDISLDRFSDLIEKNRPTPDAQVVLFSNSGKIVANTTGQHINEDISKVLGSNISSKNVIIGVDEGKSQWYVVKDSLGNKKNIFIQPFSFGKINTNWGLAAIIPLKSINRDANKLTQIAVILAIIGLILIIIISTFLINSIIKPLGNAVDALEKISEFDISKAYKLKVSNLDELGKIERSINDLIDSLTEIRNFTQSIAEGNLDVEYTPKSKKDVIGTSLIQMQRNLKIAKLEDEKRQEEEKIQRWAIEGEAKIGEILRDYSQTPEELYYQIISFLVKYTDSVQGALFIVDKEQKIIKLVAAYAYDRKKFFEKEIPFGVGLIGRSFIEGESLYITNVPKGYSSISSGLGEQEPRSVLIAPLKFNDEIFAIVELDTFKDYKAYVRNFVEKVGINIASTIANSIIGQQTRELVKELQEQSEMMKIQEKELRKNIEKLKTTKDEIKRTLDEYETIVNALNQVSYIVEYNMDREIININNKFLLLLNKSRNEMLGMKQGAFIEDEEQKKQLDELWKNLENGKISMFTQKVNIDGKIMWFAEAYIPILDENGKPYKVLNISNDITNIMEKR